MNQQQHQKEADFHNGWADETPLDSVKVIEYWNAPTAMENKYILSILPTLKGKKILDIGAGLGESSIMFAKQGADVTAVDISPHMSAFSKKLAHHHGVQIETLTCPAEAIPLDAQEWDIIHTANTIHHLAGKNDFLLKVNLLLKPGGWFVSWDPVKYNPIIAVYRRIATKVRTEDEAPLGMADLRLIRSHFPILRTRHYWLLTQLLFIKYFLLDRAHPNENRYWKRIYNETEQSLWWWKILQKIDLLLLQLPLVKWLSWNMVIIAQKPCSLPSIEDRHNPN
jgi:2-polyprenyl-3-methyl-5-hydroxy-6-metoxy-1,4-benzoquinol methylase